MFFLGSLSTQWKIRYNRPSDTRRSTGWIRSSPDPQIFENPQSDPVLIRPCKIMYHYLASWGKSTIVVILPLVK